MDPAQEYVLQFGAVFMFFLMIYGVCTAYREKDKRGYLLASLAAFLMFLTIVFILLNHQYHALALIFFVSAGVAAVASVPSIAKIRARKMKEWMEVDLSAPMILRDFFTTKGWLKLAYRWGVWKTVSLYYLFNVAVIGGGSFALNLWLKIMSTTFITTYTVTISLINAFMLQNQINKALKGKKPSEVERIRSAYRSLNAEDLYRRLLGLYIQVWGSRLGGTSVLERKIQSCMKQGFNREEAIRKTAAWEFEGIPWET